MEILPWRWSQTTGKHWGLSSEHKRDSFGGFFDGNKSTGPLFNCFKIPEVLDCPGSLENGNRALEMGENGQKNVGHSLGSKHETFMGFFLMETSRVDHFYVALSFQGILGCPELLKHKKFALEMNSNKQRNVGDFLWRLFWGFFDWEWVHWTVISPF